MEFEMFHNPIGAFRRKADYNHDRSYSGGIKGASGSSVSSHEP